MNFYKSSKMTKWGISIKSALNSNLVGNLSYSRTFNNILGQGDTSHLEDDGQGCSILMSKLPSMSSLLRTIHIDLQMPAQGGHQILLMEHRNRQIHQLEKPTRVEGAGIGRCKTTIILWLTRGKGGYHIGNAQHHIKDSNIVKI